MEARSLTREKELQRPLEGKQMMYKSPFHPHHHTVEELLVV